MKQQEDVLNLNHKCLFVKVFIIISILLVFIIINIYTYIYKYIIDERLGVLIFRITAF
jgi:hypothetical protein